MTGVVLILTALALAVVAPGLAADNGGLDGDSATGTAPVTASADGEFEPADFSFEAYVTPGQQSAAPNETVNFQAVVNDADEGIRSMDFIIEVQDPSIARIGPEPATQSDWNVIGFDGLVDYRRNATNTSVQLLGLFSSSSEIPASSITNEENRTVFEFPVKVLDDVNNLGKAVDIKPTRLDGSAEGNTEYNTVDEPSTSLNPGTLEVGSANIQFNDQTTTANGATVDVQNVDTGGVDEGALLLTYNNAANREVLVGAETTNDGWDQLTDGNSVTVNVANLSGFDRSALRSSGQSEREFTAHVLPGYTSQASSTTVNLINNNDFGQPISVDTENNLTSLFGSDNQASANVTATVPSVDYELSSSTTATWALQRENVTVTLGSLNNGVTSVDFDLTINNTAAVRFGDKANVTLEQSFVGDPVTLSNGTLSFSGELTSNPGPAPQRPIVQVPILVPSSATVGDTAKFEFDTATPLETTFTSGGLPYENNKTDTQNFEVIEEPDSNFDVSFDPLSPPNAVLAGNSVNVIVEVTNIGPTDQTAPVELDAESLGTRTSSARDINSGQTITQSFTLSTTDVGINNLTASVVQNSSETQLDVSVDVDNNGKPASDARSGAAKWDLMFDDVSGTGSFGIEDVVALFNNFGKNKVDDNAEFFRFNDPTNPDPTRVGIADVVALFEEL
jgi:hypothetical protein